MPGPRRVTEKCRAQGRGTSTPWCSAENKRLLWTRCLLHALPSAAWNPASCSKKPFPQRTLMRRKTGERLLFMYSFFRDQPGWQRPRHPLARGFTSFCKVEFLGGLERGCAWVFHLFSRVSHICKAPGTVCDTLNRCLLNE